MRGPLSIECQTVRQRCCAYGVSPQVWLGLTYVELCIAPGAVSVPTFK